MRRQIVDRGDPDVVAGDRALAEEDQPARTVEPEPLGCFVHGVVEHVQPLARVSRDPEPGRPDRA